MPSSYRYSLSLVLILFVGISGRAVSEPALDLRALDNQLIAAALSRPARKSAIVAIQVQAGSFHDTVSGQAHLAEHLFLRSRFASEDQSGRGIRDFMSTNGGVQNGSTSYEHTRFYFELAADSLDTFLWNLAHIIAHPDFNLAALQSEISAIEHEFSQLKTRQFWRLHDALKSATTQQHPFRRFKSGSLAAFAQHTPQQLLASTKQFLDGYYHVGNMTVLVVAPFSPEKIHSMIDDTLGRLPTGGQRPAPAAPLFDTTQLPLRLHIADPTTPPQLNLLIPMTGISGELADEFIDFLKFWSEAEGAGSWQRQFIASGLANRVKLGRGIGTGSARTLSITLSLTDDGVQAVPELTAITMDALQSLAREASASSLWPDFSRQWHGLPSPSGPIDQRYALRLLGSLAKRAKTTDATGSVHFSYSFDPNHVLAVVVGDGVATDQFSPVFGVPYSLLPLAMHPVDNASKLAKFSSPTPRGTIPLDNLAESASRPKRLLESPLLTTWHSVGDSESDTILLKLSLKLPSANETLESRTLWSVWYEDLRRFAERDNSSRWYRHAHGAGIEMRGNVEQLTEKLITLSDRLRRPLPAADFGILKQALIHDWQSSPNYHFAFEVLVHKLKQLILPGTDDSATKLSVIKPLNVEQLTALQERALRTMHTTLFVYGATESQARRLADSFHVDRTDEVPRLPLLSADARDLASGHVDTLRVTMPGDESALLRYHQLPYSMPEDDAKFRLLLPLIRRQYFSSIREQQRLAYGVNVVPVALSERRGIAFIAQSASTQPDELHLATRSLLHEFPRWLNALPPESFQQLKGSIYQELQATPKNGKELADHYWTQIAHERVDAHWDQSVSKALDDIDIQELLRYYHSAFDANSQRAIILEGWQRDSRRSR